MQSRDIYLGQESLEDVLSHIQGSLKRGSSVFSIARGMVGTKKAELIITKEYEMHLDEFKSDRDIIKQLTEYINDTFGEQMKSSCVSPVIKKLMEENYLNSDMDDYADFLTELLNTDGYQRVGNHITNIMACFAPYMRAKCPNEFKNMNKHELEVELIAFIKEHLLLCVKNDK